MASTSYKLNFQTARKNEVICDRTLSGDDLNKFRKVSSCRSEPRSAAGQWAPVEHADGESAPMPACEPAARRPGVAGTLPRRSRRQVSERSTGHGRAARRSEACRPAAAHRDVLATLDLRRAAQRGARELAMHPSRTPRPHSSPQEKEQAGQGSKSSGKENWAAPRRIRRPWRTTGTSKCTTTTCRCGASSARRRRSSRRASRSTGKPRCLSLHVGLAWRVALG